MKTIKFRIEPNSVQRDIIDQMIDANRLVYNNMLTACRIRYSEDKELPTVFDLNKLSTRMRNNSPYVQKAHSMTLQETSKRVIRACEDSLGEHKKESGTLYVDTMRFSMPNHHLPRYKGSGQFSSFTYPSNKVFSLTVEKRGRKKKRYLKLGKIPGTIRCYNQSTPITGDMKTCTIKRKDMGPYSLYFACIAYEPYPEPFTEPAKGPIGVDMGVHNIVALSDGTVFPNDSMFSESEGELGRYQKKLSRTSVGTPRYRKFVARINHIYEKITNHRKNNIEQISSYIVRNHNPIVMENLSVKALRSVSKNRKMTKGYNDASLGILRRRIEDKASSAGREIILVDPKGTSQICSECHETVKKDLSIRTHVCPYCGYTADRDVNAARNILHRSHPETQWVDQPPLSLG